MNGLTFRWLDKAKYETGGFRHVWESIRPHFEEVQATLQRVTILAGSLQSLISDSGDSEFYRQRKEAISAEIKASLDLYFGRQGKEEKQMRLAVSELIFAVQVQEGADQLPLEQLERGLRILHAYEKVPQRNLGKQRVGVTADHRDHPGVRPGAGGTVGHAVLGESVLSCLCTYQAWSDTRLDTGAGCGQELQVSDLFSTLHSLGR